jgi:hypothetical protein
MKRLILLALTTSLVACATPYQRQGATGGFDEFPMDADTYTVTFKGNGYTSKEKVQMYLHYRCAELTLETGHDSFAILETENKDRHGQFQRQGHSTTTTTGSATAYGNTAYGSATSHTTYTPGQTISYTMPEKSATIRMFRGPKPEGAFDAREVMRMLGPRIGAQ